MKKKPIKHLALKTHWARRFSYFFYAATFITFSGTSLNKHSIHTNIGWIGLTICLIPLLAFLPGLLKGSPKNQVILCFFLLLYFCFAVMDSFLPGAVGYWATATALAESGLFISAMLYARWQGRTNHLFDKGDG